MPFGAFQVHDTVLSPTPLLLEPVTVGAKARPYGVTESDAGLASPGVVLREETAQTVTAVAEMNNGTFWLGSADVIVTLAACLESG